MSNKHVILAAGGTGGHLFPAFALAEELIRRNHIVDLITDKRGERFRGDFPGRDVYIVNSATFASRSPFAILQAGWKLVSGTWSTWRLLGRLRPQAVVGFGGYPTFPPLVASYLRKIPCAVHEQNAVMGRANRFFAKFVTTIAMSFKDTKYITGELLAKSHFTGNPVRNIVREWSSVPYTSPQPGGDFHLLVFGGSQGARFFSDVVPQAVTQLPQELRRRLKIVQQCREEDAARVEKAYIHAGIAADIAPFFENLAEYITQSHLVIARSGASSVAELAVLGRPSLLVPLPHALDNDQLLNAKRLTDTGGACYIPQDELDAERLNKELTKFLSEPFRLAHAARAAKEMGEPDAVNLLAHMVEGL
ncbi:MAG: undecaprenyldiphospho-muramoylpentapeptide beta-N-acetylglucosaminyltransferase [Pseudomonadota bacterium]